MAGRRFSRRGRSDVEASERSRLRLARPIGCGYAHGVRRWQKFEDLVRQIHEALDGEAFTIEHDVTLVEPGGATHQIDVRLTPKSPFFGPVLISCKSSGDPVGVAHVREWANIVQETGAAAGIIVSPVGFTADALAAARAPTRRVTLWVPRAFAEGDFAPDERAPRGYLRSTHITMRMQVPQPRTDRFVLQLESATGRSEGRQIAVAFSARAREQLYLRDAEDNVVGNLWDEYIAAAEALQASGVARVEPAEPRFLVLDGCRVRFHRLELPIDMHEVEHIMEIDLMRSAFVYQNAVTGETRTVPLPPALLV